MLQNFDSKLALKIWKIAINIEFILECQTDRAIDLVIKYENKN